MGKSRPEAAETVGSKHCWKSMILRPIRMNDFEMVRMWRNQQMHLLRQDHALTRDEQRAYAERYFDNLATGKPTEVLFSCTIDKFMQGYGGFVHIDWEEGSAEISYLVNPKKMVNLVVYAIDWLMFLKALRHHGNALGIHKWRAETFTSTGDPTRNLHIILLGVLFHARMEQRDNSVIQCWEVR